MLKPLCHGLLALSLASGVIATRAGAQEHPAANLPVPRSSLTPAERARAIQIAAPQAPAMSLFALHPQTQQVTAPNRVVVSNVQAVGAGKTDKRLAVVTLYQYDGNVTIN